MKLLFLLIRTAKLAIDAAAMELFASCPGTPFEARTEYIA